ncbi:MAG: formate dehydrogenase subunit delta [Alphaproteobacteria bacterium]|nr:formate dehydrogenase subunit delta [Alphaproteobacteria bacterium]
MKRQDIVRMANQIADFHRSYPEEEAVAGVAQHIRDFWDPRMRADLAELLAREETGFNDLARAGARRVVAEDRPAA